VSAAQTRMVASLNRLCKWRTVLTGRHVGTKPKTDPEVIAFRDLYDKLLILRAEHTALSGLLIAKGIITADQLASAVAAEADELERDYQKAFPGVRATDAGLIIDRRAEAWLKDLKL
jgi:hypothetical protein